MALQRPCPIFLNVLMAGSSVVAFEPYLPVVARVESIACGRPKLQIWDACCGFGPIFEVATHFYLLALIVHQKFVKSAINSCSHVVADVSSQGNLSKRGKLLKWTRKGNGPVHSW